MVIEFQAERKSIPIAKNAITNEDDVNEVMTLPSACAFRDGRITAAINARSGMLFKISWSDGEVELRPALQTNRKWPWMVKNFYRQLRISFPPDMDVPIDIFSMN